MYSWKSRPKQKNKHMDRGKPSLQNRPETYKTMEIPSPSVENTSPTTEVQSHTAFRTHTSIPENIRIVKCILEKQDPDKLNTWISGDRVWTNHQEHINSCKSRIRVSKIPPPQKKCILIYHFVDIDRFQKISGLGNAFWQSKNPNK